MGHSHSKANLPKTKYAPQQTINITHFSFIYQLGKGTFCKVIAAENNLTGEILALKYCFKEKLHEKKAINHIVQERNLLEDISHPFICNILYSFQDHAYVYMALELMTGGDLRDHVASPMPESGVRIIIAEIASALEYLHVRNIVHRDLKPDNSILFN